MTCARMCIADESIQLQLGLLRYRCEGPWRPGCPSLVSFQGGVDCRGGVAAPTVALPLSTHSVEEKQHCANGFVVFWARIQKAEDMIVRDVGIGGLADPGDDGVRPQRAGLSKPS